MNSLDRGSAARTRTIDGSCSGCGSTVGPGTRFCRMCGTPVTIGACSSCGSPIQSGANFCTKCGNPAFGGTPKQNANESDLLVSAIQLLIQGSHPERVLELCNASLQAQPQPAASHAALASLLSMSCYARLEKFEEAEAAAIRTREFYATHLEFSGDQRARFVSSGYLIDDLQDAGDRDLTENPWLYFLLGHSYGPYLSKTCNGKTEAERRNVAIRGWRNFFSKTTAIRRALAYILAQNGKPGEAAKHLESLILIARRYERVAPLRIETIWPRTMLGDCYWALNQKPAAVKAWQSARSFEICDALGAEVDDWCSAGRSWIEKAKSSLAQNKIPIPPLEVSLKASNHLQEAIQYLLEAEQYEQSSSDMEETLDSIRKAGTSYTAPINCAATELQFVERLDPLTWTNSPSRDSSGWYRYESAKGYFFHKLGLLYMSQDNLVLAIANFKQAIEVWPMLSWNSLLGALQAAGGLTSDARATYRMCIEQAEEMSAFESSEDCEQILRNVQLAVQELQ